MIQVYLPNNTNYTKNGDMVLLPETVEINVELNGAWEVVLIHPLDEEGRWEYLVDNAVVKMPSWNGEQLFRIRTKDKSDFEGVTCILDPIFFDAAQDCFLEDIRPTQKNGQQALDIMTAVNTKYTGVSNISVVSTAYYEYMNLLEAISGEQDNSFLNRWGGEIEYDNYTIRILSRLGSDRGVEFRYGRNIQGVMESVDMTDVVTRIYPKAFNGRKMSSKKVDSPLINSYPTVRAREMEFDYIVYKDDVTETDVDDPNIVICNTQAQLDSALASACQYQFDAGIDKPVVTITIDGIVPDFVEFQNVTLGLGDTVYLRHPVLDIVTEARVVGLTYDAIREEVTGVTIGSVAYNYFNSVSSAVARIETAVRPDGSVRAETVKGIVDMKKANLYAQYDQAEAQDVVGILFENNDSTSQLYGAMAIGTQGFMIADTKDASGNWVWKTWGTAKGLIADYIVAGTLAAADGESYWDLDNSIFRVYDSDLNVYVELKNGNLAFGRNGTDYGYLQKFTLSGEDVIGLKSIAGDYVVVGSRSAWLQGLDKVVIASQDGYLRNEADTHIYQLAGTYINETAGTYIQERAGEWARMSAGSNATDCYMSTQNDGTYRFVDLHANDYDYVRVDGDSHYIRLSAGTDSIGTSGEISIWAADIKYKNATMVLQLTTPSFNSLPKTFYHSAIRGYHVIPYGGSMELSNPAAQIGDWTITTADGSITISGTINGTTTAKFTLVNPTDSETASTTA